jgi:hypothetical protein
MIKGVRVVQHAETTGHHERLESKITEMYLQLGIMLQLTMRCYTTHQTERCSYERFSQLGRYGSHGSCTYTVISISEPHAEAS